MGLPVSSRRFEELAGEFLAYQRIYSDDRRTVASNVRILNRHLGSLSISEISPRKIEEMIAARIHGGVARSTVNRQRATLSRFFRWAIRNGHHPGPNPVTAVQQFRESPGRTRFLTAEEASALMLAAAPHLKPIIVAALHTGGRLGELLALRWEDVDLDRRVITFRRETTKARRQRIVPISPTLEEALRPLRLKHPWRPVFRFRGEGLRSVRRAFVAARRKANLPGLLFHTLRHTFASWAVMNGMKLPVLQKLLGHHSIVMTQRYAHLSEDFLLESVRHIGPPVYKTPTIGVDH